MHDYNHLIGLTQNEAIEILKADGIADIETILNVDHNDKCDTTLVCAVRVSDNKATLICGEFYLDFNEVK